jgi:hypothetical protein
MEDNRPFLCIMRVGTISKLQFELDYMRIPSNDHCQKSVGGNTNPNEKHLHLKTNAATSLAPV